MTGPQEQIPQDVPSVALVTLGCARNEVDSSELGGRLASAGWRLVDDVQNADVAVVNTCGFIEQAKKDSIDAVLEAAAMKSCGRTRAVVAVGCLAERYGDQLASSLTEADAVLGFDSYPQIARSLRAVLDGHAPAAVAPSDRRLRLPIAPARRATVDVPTPGHGRITRSIEPGRAWEPLKIASGCDRRCTFCAIPSFRGSFVSRPAEEVLAEARWLVEQGVKEVLLVSENSTSYGKDFGDLRALEKLLTELDQVDGLDRIRVSYLQPAEVRPGLVETMADLPRVAAYFDFSFQHASSAVLRRMRRFGSSRQYLELIERARELVPAAGFRSSFIVGFPGETEDDLAELTDFLTQARLDAVGVFGYSDEDGTDAERMDGKLGPELVDARTEQLRSLVEELMTQRAEDRIGHRIRVLVDDPDGPRGRAEHQAPDVDGDTLLVGCSAEPGDWIDVTVIAVEGVDLIAEPVHDDEEVR